MLHHLKAIWLFRYFWLSLVRMDLRTRYRRSVLGIGWSVLNPVLMSVVLVLGFGQILGMERWTEFGAFLLPSLCVWDYIRGSTTMGCLALMHNEAYIRQCPLPYGIYPLRTVMGTTIHFLLSLFVIVILVTILKSLHTEDWSFTLDPTPVRMLWAILPVTVLLFVLCWSLATIAAFTNAYFHDTQHLVEVACQLLFFLTPIMYPPDRLVGSKMEWVVAMNPINTFLELVRVPMIKGELPPTDLYLQAVGITVVVFGIAAAMLGWLQKKVIFQL